MIKAKLQLSPESLAEWRAALKKLAGAARKEIVEKALTVGGEILKEEMISTGPGPGIGMQFKPPQQLWKGGASREIKKTIDQGGTYLAVGPDKEHWYYLFTETGVKAHGVKKRKSTRYQQYGRRAGIKKKDLIANMRNARPTLSWMENGQRIFAKRVAGFKAKPFVKESAESVQDDVYAAMADVLKTEIEKAKQ